VITTILCPLTLSDASRRTFEHALAMGRWYRANVIALHVFARWVPPSGLGTYPGWMRQVPEARAQIDQELHDLVEPAKETDLHVRLTVREGNPAKEILESAGSSRADLIVLGAHAPLRFDRLAHESITETVVRNATCPVLVVAPHGVKWLPPFTGYARIVSLMDFSEHSRAALTYAVSIAEHAGASLTLMHVIETGDASQELNNGSRGITQGGAQFETADALLRTSVKDYDERRGGISGIVRAGVPSREIARLVNEVEADLVVMGVRGTRTVDPTRVGSTTTQILKCAPCPVLTVARPGPHGEPAA
jgi:nucleotide-binding universal stress UspA family protein